MDTRPDYLIVGSGLSSLSFAALMAKAGKKVLILEAHSSIGGYGHTFHKGPYTFNAQLHYVISCGEGQTVNVFLKKLGLENDIKFNKLDKNSFDRAFCEGKQLRFPYSIDGLEKNMLEICPDSEKSIIKFTNLMRRFKKASEVFPRHFNQVPSILPQIINYLILFKYRNKTLQDVFDECKLPLILQTLVSGQLLNYLAPPRELSFLVWLALENGYLNGAYYPEKHFEHVISTLVNFIKNNGGEIKTSTIVDDYVLDGRIVTGVTVQGVDPKIGLAVGEKRFLGGKNIICNADPKKAAQIIGLEKFSPKLRKKLDYEYCDSSLVFYGAVKDIDLRNYGFGSWNIWNCPLDHNKTYDTMMRHHDYSNPYFAMNSCSFHTKNRDNCQQDGQQIFQILTFGNYDYWKNLKLRDIDAYHNEKNRVFDQILDVIEKKYIPNIRDHLAFHIIGTPTTNERFVWTPKGGAYGVKLTPKNFQFNRKLTSDTSFNNFYFCSAAAGVGGFSGTIFTGIKLYEELTVDIIL